MAPSFTGRGWGWVVFTAAEAVSQLPGPPLEDPPTSPPRPSTGDLWGERGGTPGARAATTAGGAAKRSRLQGHEPRRLCGRRATKLTHGQRLARRASRGEHLNAFSGPASGVAGDWGDDLTGAERSKRSAASAAPVSSSSRLVVHAEREGHGSLRSPGTGTGRYRVSAGNAGLAVLREERQPVSGSTRAHRPCPAQRDALKPTETRHFKRHNMQRHMPQPRIPPHAFKPG